MNLAVKFNDCFKSSFLLQMYSAYSYGSNSFCFDHMEKMRAHANDIPPAASKILGL